MTRHYQSQAKETGLSMRCQMHSNQLEYIFASIHFTSTVSVKDPMQRLWPNIAIEDQMSRKFYGVGIDTDIAFTSLKALVGAINRMVG